MSKVTPAEFTEKHARRLKGSLEDIRRGVANVTEAPTAKAAKSADKMRANLIASIDSGKWARRLNSVSLEDWQKKMTEQGINRIASGIDGAHDKVLAFAEELLPHIDAGKRELANMPNISLEDNIQKMVSFTRHMAKFQSKR